MARCIHDRVTSQCSICRPQVMFGNYRRRAIKERGLTFTLSFEEFESLTTAPCVFCGETPSMGIDRKDNRIGYVPKNCQPACGPCNMLKKALDQYTFLLRVQKIADHQVKLRKQKLEQKSTGLVVPESQPPRPDKATPVPFNPDIPPAARQYLDGARR